MKNTKKNKTLGKNIISSIYLCFGLAFLILFIGTGVLFYLNKNEISGFYYKISSLFGVYLLLYIVLTTFLASKVKKLINPLDKFVYKKMNDRIILLNNKDDLKRVIDYIDSELDALEYAYNSLMNVKNDLDETNSENEDKLENIDKSIEKTRGYLLELTKKIKEIVKYSSKIELFTNDIQNIEDSFKGNSANLENTSESMNLILKLCNKASDDTRYDMENTSKAYGVLIEGLNNAEESLENLFSEITIIQTFASQSNLYALNTSLEASRSGHLNLNVSNALDEIINMSEKLMEKSDQIALILIQAKNAIKLSMEHASICKEQTDDELKTFGVLSDRIKDAKIEIEGARHSIGEITDDIRQVSLKTFDISKINENQQNELKNVIHLTEELNGRIGKISLIANQTDNH